MVLTSAAKVSPPHIQQAASRYAAGVFVALLSLALSYALRSVLNPSLFIFIFVAVTASAAYGGFGPAALTSVLCVLGADMLLIGAAGLPEFEDPANYLRLAALLMASVPRCGSGIHVGCGASLYAGARARRFETGPTPGSDPRRACKSNESRLSCTHVA